MNYIIFSYSIYLPIALALIIWVARTLHGNSKIFLLDIFHGQGELAASVNRLLQTGFYLISVGYAIIKLKIENGSVYDPTTDKYLPAGITGPQEMMETLSYKLGGFILVLGFLLFFNLFMLLILRSNAKQAGRISRQFVPPSDLV
jgi:hypothetical protein